MTTFIYRHPAAYRALMTLLHKGRYKERFNHIASLVPEEALKVTELCFGDTVLAKRLQANGHEWFGVDESASSVERARRKGLNAETGDAASLPNLGRADALICQGSLYHFKHDARRVLLYWVSLAPLVIISEPTTNFSAGKGFLAIIARFVTKTGSNSGSERFNKTEFTELVKRVAREADMRLEIEFHDRDTLAIFTAKSSA